jgi:hypothetical protein
VSGDLGQSAELSGPAGRLIKLERHGKCAREGKSFLMIPAGLSWRDRLLLVNSVLLCVVGGALIARYVGGQVPPVGAILGVGMLAFGTYRLLLARRELRKRARGSGSQ